MRRYNPLTRLAGACAGAPANIAPPPVIPEAPATPVPTPAAHSPAAEEFQRLSDAILRLMVPSHVEVSVARRQFLDYLARHSITDWRAAWSPFMATLTPPTPAPAPIAPPPAAAPRPAQAPPNPWRAHMQQRIARQVGFTPEPVLV